jgi:Tol biopolymer transport system component
MSVEAGQTLQHYKLVEKLGEGGMGEVWLARDVRLERDVAVKVLPPGFAANEQFRARFEREGKAISSLNHPHICTLFDIGTEGDTQFLVMERLEGESLGDRIKSKGALPIEEVLEIGAQVASALAAAHKSGITHRDLKPDNVMLTRVGGAKLLDFGLAKNATESAPPIDGLTSMPTQEKQLTREGTILGTFQYMAPEQLEGLEADARTDIFGLGALLYEMCTGRPAFEGKNKTSLIAAIVSKEPPPISSVQAMTPPALDHVVQKCLEKDPDDRWQSAGDVASQLEWIGHAGSQAGAPVAVTTTRRRRRNVVAVAAVAGWALAAVLLGWAALQVRSSSDGPSVLRVEMVAPSGTTVGSVVQGNVALSPDGTRLAYAGAFHESWLLMVRDLATGELRGLEGTVGARFPFWSADGRSLAFFAGEKLRKIDADGGPVQVVAEAHAGRGGTWNRDGTIVFAPDIQGPLMMVSESGGASEPITSPVGQVTHRMPHFLPDGKRFLFIERHNRDQQFGDIAVGSVDGSDTRVIVEGGSNPQYADGHLFFVRDGNLVAQLFDPASLSLSGSSIALADAIEYYNPRDIGNYSVSEDGLLVYRKRTLTQSQMGWFDFEGKEIEIFGEPGYFQPADVSRDGKMVAVDRVDPGGATSDIWIMDLGRGQTTRATFMSSIDTPEVTFSPNSQRLAVSSYTSGMEQGAVVIQGLSGGGSVEEVLASSNFRVSDWSRDGRYLIGGVQETDTGHDIAYIELGDSPEVRILVSTPYDEASAQISPDGNWVTYTSDETGRLEIYVIEFPAGKRKWQVSASGGSSPWFGDDDLYFIGDDSVRAVSIADDGSGTPRLGTPRAVIDLGANPSFDGLSIPLFVDESGKRFLALRFDAHAAPEPLRLIQGWKAELER